MRLIQCLTAIWLLLSSRATLAADLVSFPSLDGSLTGGSPTELRGLLIKPEGSGPFPAVVALHGCGGLFDKQGNLKARESAWGQLLTSNRLLKKSPRLRDQIIGRGFFHSWLGCAADS